MFQNKLDFTRLDGRTYGGNITTAFRPVSLAGLSGLEFLADLEVEVEGRTQKTLIKYLVEPSIFAQGYADFSISNMSLWEYIAVHLSELLSRSEEAGCSETIH